MVRSINFFEHSLTFVPSRIRSSWCTALYSFATYPLPHLSTLVERLQALGLSLKTATGFSGSPDAPLFPSFVHFFSSVSLPLPPIPLVNFLSPWLFFSSFDTLPSSASLFLRHVLLYLSFFSLYHFNFPPSLPSLSLWRLFALHPLPFPRFSSLISPLTFSLYFSASSLLLAFIYMPPTSRSNFVLTLLFCFRYSTNPLSLSLSN